MPTTSEILIVIKAVIDDLLGKLDTVDSAIQKTKATAEQPAEIEIRGDKADQVLDELNGKLDSLRERLQAVKDTDAGLEIQKGFDRAVPSVASIAVKGLLIVKAFQAIGDTLDFVEKGFDRTAAHFPEYEGFLTTLKNIATLDLGGLLDQLDGLGKVFADFVFNLNEEVPFSAQEAKNALVILAREGIDVVGLSAKDAQALLQELADAGELLSQRVKTLREDFEATVPALREQEEALIALIAQYDNVDEAIPTGVAAQIADEAERLFKALDDLGEESGLTEVLERFGEIPGAAEAAEKAAKDFAKTLAEEAKAAAAALKILDAEIKEIAKSLEDAEERSREAIEALREIEESGPSGGRPSEAVQEELAAQRELVTILEERNRNEAVSIDQVEELVQARRKLNELQREGFGFGADPGFDLGDTEESQRAALDFLDRQREARDRANEAFNEASILATKLADAELNRKNVEEEGLAITERSGDAARDAAEGTDALADSQSQLESATVGAADAQQQLADGLLATGDNAESANEPLLTFAETAQAAGEAVAPLASDLESAAKALGEISDIDPGPLEEFLAVLDSEVLGEAADTLERGAAGAKGLAEGLEATVEQGEALPAALEKAGEAVEEFTTVESALTSEIEGQGEALRSVAAENEAFTQSATAGTQRWLTLLQQVPPLLDEIKGKLEELNDLRAEG